MSEEEREVEFGIPGVYIPGEVLFNNKLTLTDKLLFGFLRNLSQTSKGCWASNRYLGSMIGVGPQSISNSVAKLSNLGYIRIEWSDREPGVTRQQQRHIYEDHGYHERYRGLVEDWHSLYSEAKGAINQDIGVYKPDYNKRKDNSYSNSEKPLMSKKTSGAGVSAKRRPSLLNPEQPPKNGSPEKKAPWRRPRWEDAPVPTRRGCLRYEDASPAARDVLEHWNAQSGNPTHKRHSKGTEKALKALDTGILKHYGPDRLKRAITDAVGMRANPRDYTRSPPVKMGLYEFLTGNGFRRGDRTVWLHELVDGGHLRFQRRADPNREVTERLKRFYREHVTCQDVAFSAADESKFRRAAERLVEFRKRGRLERYLVGAGLDDYVHRLFVSLAERWGDSTKIQVGNLCSDYTWENLLPRYLSGEFE